MAKTDLTIRRGAVIVFEGLDQTGKSTQLNRLRGSLDAESTVFAHMPSGFTTFTERVYRALEGETADEKPRSGLAQQLAHLACHAESVPDLKRAAETRSLILDRWWWSTLAYGWYGGSVKQSGLPESSFKELIDTIWSPIMPSIVFVFLEPHHLDPNNAPGVQDGYRALLDEYAESAVVVPVASEEETHSFVTETLLNRGLAARVENR
ncbi:hypothetical protein FQ330_11350 [Agrococcus sediminis]|uniref:Thymidylate kinase n=1 Tax=Agrococcus sediminis TaxID=2599924 RepID=A0A5M8Q652_9MICO|nr:hypothetical protein [Agrococcus sediminis]KAA6431349.1 hypothetical protein FQ330_11350 [Agrococcus sediminis]